MHEGDSDPPRRPHQLTRLSARRKDSRWASMCQANLSVARLFTKPIQSSAAFGVQNWQCLQEMQFKSEVACALAEPASVLERRHSRHASDPTPGAHSTSSAESLLKFRGLRWYGFRIAPSL